MLNPAAVLAGLCYSGKGMGLNNGALQDVHGGCRWSGTLWVPVAGLTPDDWGPLPRGFYEMQLPPVDTETHGPYVIWFTPDPENEMFGRSAFGEHGDEVENPGKFLGSDGCIVALRTLRLLMANSSDTRVQVTA